MNEQELLTLAEKYLSVEKNEIFRNDLKKVIEKKDFNELNDRFYTELEFGTAGLRGIIGGGFNRMNNYIVERATQGVATYVQKTVTGNKSAVIAYDSRNFSAEFALATALVFAANGIKVYLFSSLRSTPELSFAIRYLKATTGVIVTASHNPAEYNGYKVFWANGSQITAPHDTGIVKEVLSTKEIKTITEKEALENNLLEYIDESIDKPFLDMIKSYSLRPELFKEYADKINIVYTPLYGAGIKSVPRILNEVGLNVTLVEEQSKPNGNFPTAPFPNPEIAEALSLALDLGKKNKADLVLGTDPDSDRLGIAVPNGDDFQLITGNQLGCIIAYYILSTKKEKGLLNKKSAMIKTIVTTNLADEIAKGFNVELHQVLTGFKWIANKMEEFDKNGIQFIMGYEESYGFLIETEVRDKDAVSASFITCEIALYCKSRNISILDYLNEIYNKFGFYEEFSVSKYYKGQEGSNKIKEIMSNLRNNPPKTIGGLTNVRSVDYNSANSTLPKSNVVQFILEDGTIVSARPSGTEPKIKFYCTSGIKEFNSLTHAKELITKKVDNIKNDLEKLLV